MKTAKNTAKEFLLANEKISKFFPYVLKRRLIMMGEALRDYYTSFDVLFDEQFDDSPTAVFHVQENTEEDNSVSIFVSDMKTLYFTGDNHCFDFVSAINILEQMLSPLRENGMGFEYFSPSVEDFSELVMGDEEIDIFLYYTLPVSINENSQELIEVLNRILPKLLDENRTFIAAVDDMTNDGQEEESEDTSEDDEFLPFA